MEMLKNVWCVMGLQLDNKNIHDKDFKDFVNFFKIKKNVLVI